MDPVQMIRSGQLRIAGGGLKVGGNTLRAEDGTRHTQRTLEQRKRANRRASKRARDSRRANR